MSAAIDDRKASGKAQRIHRIRAALRALRGRVADTAIDTDTDKGHDSIDQAIKTLAAASIQEVQDRSYHFQRCDYYSALNDLTFLNDNWDLWHDRSLPQGIKWELDA